MKKLNYNCYVLAGTAGLILLFLLNFCYLFAALGLFVFGIAAFPSALLGAAGIINVTSDLPFPSLMLIGAGSAAAGLGMCIGTVIVCPASVGRLKSFRAGMERRKALLHDA